MSMKLNDRDLLLRVEVNPKGIETLRMKQSRFVRHISLLIRFAALNGFEMIVGDAWADEGDCRGDLHYERLAIDFKIFKDNKLMSVIKDYRVIGEYWECIGGSWGGRFGDGCHFSLEHEGRR